MSMKTKENGPIIPKLSWTTNPFPSGTYFKAPYSIENAREAAALQQEGAIELRLEQEDLQVHVLKSS